MVEVTNREGLEKWLKGKSYEVVVTIAARSGLRVFPLTISGKANKEARQHDIIFISARALLNSSVAPISPTDEIKRAAVSSSYASASVSTTSPAAFATAISSDSAAFALSVNSFDATVLASSAVSSFGAAAVWKAVSKDIAAFEKGADVATVLGLPLWQGENPIANIWQQQRSYLKLHPIDWSFWIDWYQRILDGRPQNWDMLEEIALIDPKDWDKGAAHVNGLIAEIQARYLRDATPYSEKIEVNPDTGNLRSVPTTMESERLYQTALDRVHDALDDLRPDGELAQHHAGLEKVAKRLDRTLDRYAGNPQRVHDDFLLSARQITALVASTEVAEGEDVDALQSSLVTGSTIFGPLTLWSKPRSRHVLPCDLSNCVSRIRKSLQKLLRQLKVSVRVS